ncbi:D-amino acid oxidase [Aspergillus bombycis]|uniref:D-amino acid oxidase n=1 Tax=Aspergillus bombycis TaxID=109264 RepID=A0A1F7ZI92_9EURO|nr:D-amino acid oxidase [Aspergillus bombycis]OGM39170.1 D-amino acid oxidase [Aspergillus bombycis]
MTPSTPFHLNSDLSAGPDPLRKPAPNAPHVLVIGAGVTGLTTTWHLLDTGYHVTIISKEWASYGRTQRLTSQVAGALWELPPTQCGGVRLTDQELTEADLKTAQRWALESYVIYEKLAANAELARAFGVRMPLCASFHTYHVQDDEPTHAKMEVARRLAPGQFHWGIELAGKYGVDVSSNGGMKDAYEHPAPVIDTDVAMAFLMRLVRSKGARMYTDSIVGDLRDQESHLLTTYRADAIVNASGLGAREIASDPRAHSLRGGILRVVNDGSDFPKIESSIIVAADEDADGKYIDIAFIVPRSDDTLVLGSIEQAHEMNLDLTPNSPVIQRMRKRCEDLVPVLKNARLDPQYPFAQGLRPYRNSQIRIEREGRKTLAGQDSRIIHCYGHGGAGWSLAFGTSKACLEVVEEVVRKHTSRL